MSNTPILVVKGHNGVMNNTGEKQGNKANPVNIGHFYKMVYYIRWFHAVFIPIFVEFSRCLSTYLIVKFDL